MLSLLSPCSAKADVRWGKN